MNNLISTSFSSEDLKKINHALTTIEDTISGKVINLTADERQQYGKLGNKTENWVKKVNQYMEQKPELVPFYLDKEEFDKDTQAREDIIPVLRRMTSVFESLDDTSKLLSTDIYNAAIAYYRNIKLISQQNVPGTSNIYSDLSSQFPGRSSAVLEQNKSSSSSKDQ
ncbi:hypothetical protein [Aquimarina longa]|uniref:hypothetical protein n=1 Tax=Aquimarina longa TaxID=1080221 RepID=UPI0011E061F0|nr:hypothetical protein [Aquimarina longa]